MLRRACTTPSSGTHHNDQPQSATSNLSRATSSASASWTAKRTRRRCSLVSARPSGGDVLGARIEGVHRLRACSSERGQTSLAAADLEHAFLIERDERGDRRCLYPVFVAPLHSLVLRLVGFDGGAAGTELLCLATCVFELGAGVGVDQLAGLDPLEAVSF
jgi:hypothetical protein